MSERKVRWLLTILVLTFLIGVALAFVLSHIGIGLVIAAVSVVLYVLVAKQ